MWQSKRRRPAGSCCPTWPAVRMCCHGKRSNMLHCFGQPVWNVSVKCFNQRLSTFPTENAVRNSICRMERSLNPLDLVYVFCLTSSLRQCSTKLWPKIVRGKVKASFPPRKVFGVAFSSSFDGKMSSEAPRQNPDESNVCVKLDPGPTTQLSVTK